jgi:maltose O-acetyltransferase
VRERCSNRRSGADYGYNIFIGNRTFVNYDCLLLDCNRIAIGDEVQIAPGVTIGTNTVLGAGSVVTRDLPANVVAVGNPCRVIRHL